MHIILEKVFLPPKWFFWTDNDKNGKLYYCPDTGEIILNFFGEVREN